VRLVRIYNDAQGESHFEDLELRSETQLSSTGVTADVSEPLPAESLFFRYVISEASDVTPHVAPARLIIVHLEGAVEVEASDGEIRRFGPGEAVLVEDIAGKGHITRNLDGKPRRTLVAALPTGEPPLQTASHSPRQPKKESR
jgi:hypothetical protein